MRRVWSNIRAGRNRWRRRHEGRPGGYTLVELLLYVVIIGTLLTAVMYFFGMVTEARVKNQSINEVNEQGVAAMDYITQTIRNASSITSPAAGASSSSLTLVVPTGALSPTIFDLSGTNTVMGYDQDGGQTDSSNSNFINATKFTAGASGTVTTLYALIGPTVGASPNNKAQMAMYSGTSTPTTLLANSGDVTVAANTWVAFTIPSVSVTSGQTYWLAYNTNGTTSAQNNLRRHTGAAGQHIFMDRTYGTWPASVTGTTQAAESSMYALISAGGSTPQLRVKEGSGSAIPLTSTDVAVSNLVFKNLSAGGTPGNVQVSFTVSRVNPGNREEYNYQKTFTGSAEVKW